MKHLAEKNFGGTTFFHHILLSVLLSIFGTPTTFAQELEPRSYSNTPIGINFYLGNNARTVRRRAACGCDPHARCPATTTPIAAKGARSPNGIVKEPTPQVKKLRK